MGAAKERGENPNRQIPFLSAAATLALQKFPPKKIS